MKGIETLLTIVRNRSKVDAATGAVFTLVPTKPGLVRVNYEGLILLMKVLFKVLGDDGLVSYGSSIAPRDLSKIRTGLSLMRMDAIRLGSSDAALTIEQFSDALVTASDGQTRAIAVVYSDTENQKNAAAVEQEYFKHIKDFELRTMVGKTLFDDLEFEESVAYQKARCTVARYGYPGRQIFRKVLGKLARDDASETLGIFADEVEELRRLFRKKAFDLGLTPEQYSVTYAGVSHSQDSDIDEYRREYYTHLEDGSTSNGFQFGAKVFDIKACLGSGPYNEGKFVPVNMTTAKYLDEFLSAGWIVYGDAFTWTPSFGAKRNIPIRIRLKDFSLSKHQRRVLKKNSHLRVEAKNLSVTEAECALFEDHKIRLAGNVPTSLFNAVPGTSSNEIKTVTVMNGESLLAASYLVIGKTSTYSIWAMYEPTMRSSLGILTILKEIEYSMLQKKSYYYLGYVHLEPSYYDYKKRFHALESLDEKGNWTDCVRLRDQRCRESNAES